MKYLFLIYSLRNGGAERVTSLLCNELINAGCEVHIGLYQRTEADYPIDDRIKIHQLNEEPYSSKIRNVFGRIGQLAKLIDKVNPDITIGMMTNIEYTLAALGRRARYISAVRIDPAQPTAKKMDKYLRNISCALSSGIFVQNQMQKEYYPKWLQKKTFAVSNPVGNSFLQADYSCGREIRHIVTSGRLTTQKNQKMLIEAVMKVAQVHPNIQLSIYGIGSLEKPLKEYIHELRAEDHVRLAGRSNDMLGTLMENDLFILSSDYEGMPNALLEAMAMGMPCISTDCRTGPSEMIEHGKNGLLVPVGDTEKMAEAISYMIEHADEAKQMGRHAREYARENCGMSVVLKRFRTECERFIRS